MKNVRKLSITCFAFAMVLMLGGCYETHYYHSYHHHSREWYGRHHTPPPAGVNFELDIRK